MSVVVQRRTRRVTRWIGYTALTLVVLLLLAVAGGYAVARRSLPRVSGELVLPGLRALVTVYRDEWGVPHIEAQNEHDLYMAQGYVVAQDRLFQMDLTRRAAAGRLAEVIGPSQLETDKFFRALNLRRAAEASVQSYGPWARELLEAYAAGVNAFIAEAKAQNRLPVEFLLLGYEPEPWSPVDSALIGKIMAYDLGGNFEAEVYRLQLRNQVGPELADQLMPVYPEDGITMIRYRGGEGAEEPRPGASAVAGARPPGSSLDLTGLLALLRVPDEGRGSNNWVVAGSGTRTGKPLLANDPHLGARTPSIWYEQHLVVPGMINAYGVMFPGAPGIVIGQNERIAWGVTNTNPDVQDLYIERRNPDNPYQFEYMGRWEDALVHRELIGVKGQDPVPFEVVITRHGPIISEVVGDPDNRPEEALALKWTAHMATPELEAVLLFPKARNWEEFREALRSFHVPTQNFVYADVDGTIAYRTGGLVPIRRSGDGLLPVPGWTDEYEWVGFIPFDQMPEAVNPPEGYIVTANNKVIDDAYPYFLTYSWSQPYRAMRIAEMIEAKLGDLTADDMQAMQVDYANLHARTLLPVLLPAVERAGVTGTAATAVELLKSWDMVDSADQPQPLIFHLWWSELTRMLYEPLMGEELYRRMADKGNVTDMALLAAAEGRPNGWIEAAGGLDKLAADSLQAAVDRAVALQGSDPGRWSWGRYHRLQPPHPVGAAAAPLGWLLNPTSYPIGGSGVTVGAMSFGSDGMVRTFAPWRQVVDLADPTGNSRSIVTPGQSGHFLSPHYDDQSAMHSRGELITRNFHGYRTGRALRLLPDQAGAGG
ncbi:penicillin acylase family protein [Symbiobacterium thermophilum]|uniref:Penicillin acylase family protein n=1 Tax=Symbiobacterium thermophilum TaxID=2734 RepID=A0A953LJF8_SYMTR|nr:penicillin acylase family protein [Symbiobacterium thermophilum]MBY6275797.1 penicillin acylase family protein [Symbiobacterium thermophilum]